MVGMTGLEPATSSSQTRHSSHLNYIPIYNVIIHQIDCILFAMALIYITGISGSGKSTIAQELKKRRYEAIDADNDGYNQWHNNETNEIVPSPGDKIVHTPEWLATHGWVTSIEKVTKLAERAKNKTIFFCSTAGHEKELWALYSRVICLVIDENTLKHRVATRDSNTFGKKKHELDAILKWLPGKEENYRKFGATIVDATQPLNKVVDEIIKLASD